MALDPESFYEKMMSDVKEMDSEKQRYAQALIAALKESPAPGISQNTSAAESQGTMTGKLGFDKKEGVNFQGGGGGGGGGSAAPAPSATSLPDATPGDYLKKFPGGDEPTSAAQQGATALTGGVKGSSGEPPKSDVSTDALVRQQSPEGKAAGAAEYAKLGPEKKITLGPNEAGPSAPPMTNPHAKADSVLDPLIGPVMPTSGGNDAGGGGGTP
jgi:hypothetical protein